MITIVLSHKGLSMHHHFKLHFFIQPFVLFKATTPLSRPPACPPTTTLATTDPQPCPYASMVEPQQPQKWQRLTSSLVHPKALHIAMEDSSSRATSGNYGDRAFAVTYLLSCCLLSGCKISTTTHSRQG